MMLNSAYYLATKCMMNSMKIDNISIETQLLQNIGLDIAQNIKYLIFDMYNYNLCTL